MVGALQDLDIVASQRQHASLLREALQELVKRVGRLLSAAARHIAAMKGGGASGGAGPAAGGAGWRRVAAAAMLTQPVAREGSLKASGDLQ